MSQKPLNAKELVAGLRGLSAYLLSTDEDEAEELVRDAADYIERTAPPARKFALGDRVTKTKGSSWTGKVVGFYSTALTPVGYAVESEREPGSVQIYPEAALEAAPPADGLPEFETTAEERAEWQADVNDRLDPRLDCNDFGRLLADVTKAIALAALATKDNSPGP